MKKLFLLLIAISGCFFSKAQINVGASQTDFKSYSKFDFVPGEQVIFFEDFLQDAIGDFPVNWNTNGTGEVIGENSF